MKLENIGFYTLEDKRAKELNKNSPMWRCELIVTDRCNFSCPYCRGIDKNFKKELTIDEAKNVVSIWAKDNLKNIRFSGGEPTLWPHLLELVNYAKSLGINRIAISTNGFSDYETYYGLFLAGVNDFSISLDGCCASMVKTMSGGIDAFEKIKSNIKKLSELTYVTVGIVLDTNNFIEAEKTISFADSLGVSDIRIISTAQWNNKTEFKGLSLSEKFLNKYPILKYRYNNFKNNINVRGLSEGDSHKCYLGIDDSVVIGDYHYPCIIHARESMGKDYIGKVNDNMRNDRINFFKDFDTHKNTICKQNCLDVCRHYNNSVEKFGNKNVFNS